MELLNGQVARDGEGIIKEGFFPCGRCCLQSDASKPPEEMLHRSDWGRMLRGTDTREGCIWPLLALKPPTSALSSRVPANLRPLRFYSSNKPQPLSQYANECIGTWNNQPSKRNKLLPNHACVSGSSPIELRGKGFLFSSGCKEGLGQGSRTPSMTRHPATTSSLCRRYNMPKILVRLRHLTRQHEAHIKSVTPTVLAWWMDIGMVRIAPFRCSHLSPSCCQQANGRYGRTRPSLQW